MTMALIGAMGGVRKPEAIWLQGTASTAGGGNTSDVTFTNQPLRKRMMVSVAYRGTSMVNKEITGVSAGGIAGTQLAEAEAGGTANGNAELWVVTGIAPGTGDVVVTWTGGGTVTARHIGLWELKSFKDYTASDAAGGTNTGTSISRSIAVPKDGYAFLAGARSVNGDIDVSGVDEVYDDGTGTNFQAAFGSGRFEAADTPSLEISASGSGTQWLAVASLR